MRAQSQISPQKPFGFSGLQRNTPFGLGDRLLPEVKSDLPFSAGDVSSLRLLVDISKKARLILARLCKCQMSHKPFIFFCCFLVNLRLCLASFQGVFAYQRRSNLIREHTPPNGDVVSTYPRIDQFDRVRGIQMHAGESLAN